MRRTLIILLVGGWLSAVMMSTVVTVAVHVYWKTEDLTRKRLPEVDQAVKDDTMVWTVDLVVSLEDIKSQSHDHARTKLKRYERRMRMLNKYLQHFFIPQLNFMRPATKASRNYKSAVLKILESRTNPQVRGGIDNQLTVEKKLAHTKEYSIEYHKALKRVKTKLQNLRRTSLRCLLVSVAILSGLIVLTVITFLVVFQSLFSFLYLQWQRRSRRAASRLGNIIPAYIIKGRLFVDRNYHPANTHDDDSALLDDDLDNDDDPEAPMTSSQNNGGVPLLNPIAETELTRVKDPRIVRHRRTPDAPDGLA